MWKTYLATHPPIFRYGFRRNSERRQLSVWRKRFPNRLYKSLCFPSVFWLAASHCSVSCLCVSLLNGRHHSSLSSSSSLIHAFSFFKNQWLSAEAGLFLNIGDFSLTLFLNSSNFLIFSKSELVAWNNTCKMALRNMCLLLLHIAKKNLKLSILKASAWPS